MSASLSGDLPDHSSAGWAYARRLGPRSPPSLPAASCAASWSTTSALLLAPRASLSRPSMTRAPTQPLRALSQLSRRTRRSSCLVSLTKPWLNGSSSGTTCSLGPRTRCRTCPLRLSGTIAASLRTMVMLELGDAEVHHTWMWRLHPHHGAVLEPEESVDSVRLRLGCAGPCEPSGSLDTGATHATCCALGEATRGHNAVTALVHAAAQSCDCTAETEVLGLIPGTDLRPANVLLATPTPPSTSRSALRTPSRPRLTAHKPGVKPNSPTTAYTYPLSSPPEDFLHPDRLERLRATSPRHVDRSALSQQIPPPPSSLIARKRNSVSAEVVSQKLHSSITLEIWKRRGRPANSGLLARCGPSRLSGSSPFVPTWGPRAPSLLWGSGLCCAGVSTSLGLCWF